MTTDVPRVVDAPSAAWGSDYIAIEADQPYQQIVPADPRRRGVVIVTDPNLGGILYLNPSGGGVSGGVPILPGGGFTLNTGAAIYARSTGGPQRVQVVSETGWSC